jgi:predicted nucleotidyltransferase
MSHNIYAIEKIRNIVKPIAHKYNVQAIYLFGSYARGEATETSDLDFLVFGGENFKLTNIFALAED